VPRSPAPFPGYTPDVRKTLLALVVPEGLVLLLAAVLVRWPAALDAAGPVLAFLPLLVPAAGLLLAWRFDRGRVFFALLALALVDRGISWAGVAGTSPEAVRDLAGVLLPVGLAALALLPDPGIFTAAGLRRALALAAAGALVLVLARPETAALTAALAGGRVAGALPGAGRMGDPALAAFALAFVLLLVLTLRGQTPEARGFLWAAAAALLGLAAPAGAGAAALPADGWFLTTAALVLAIAVVESSYAMAFRDALTGLPGRRAFDKALHRLEGPAVVAMVDVDRFKAFNDQYGHAVGDQVLRMVATRLDDVGAGGRVFRYGGEEFAILFAGGRLDDVRPALEGVRAAVEAAEFILRGPDRPKKKPKQTRRRRGTNRVAVTISIGAAHRDSREPPGAELVAAADGALYRAKEGGRNRVRIAGERAARTR